MVTISQTQWEKQIPRTSARNHGDHMLCTVPGSCTHGGQLRPFSEAAPVRTFARYGASQPETMAGFLLRHLIHLSFRHPSMESYSYSLQQKTYSKQATLLPRSSFHHWRLMGAWPLEHFPQRVAATRSINIPPESHFESHLEVHFWGKAPTSWPSNPLIPSAAGRLCCRPGIFTWTAPLGDVNCRHSKEDFEERKGKTKPQEENICILHVEVTYIFSNCDNSEAPTQIQE